LKLCTKCTNKWSSWWGGYKCSGMRRCVFGRVFRTFRRI